MSFLDKMDKPIVDFVDGEQGKKVTEAVKWVFAGEVLAYLGLSRAIGDAGLVIAVLPLLWICVLVARKYGYKEKPAVVTPPIQPPLLK